MSGFVELALFTDSVERTRGFYEHLLGATPEAAWSSGAIYATGGIKLLVHERASEPEDGPPNEDHVAVGVADLDSTYDELRAQGVTFLVEPRDYPWGRSAYLRDPDGRLVELIQT